MSVSYYIYIYIYIYVYSLEDRVITNVPGDRGSIIPKTKKNGAR